MTARQLSPLDQLLANAQQALATVFGDAPEPGRPSPAEDVDDAPLSSREKRHAAGLMRINHAGEIAAQALYQGQALTARLDEVRDAMDEAAREETDHLAWCEARLDELDSHVSVLNPLWYAGSFVIGATAGLLGDRWSLGFVGETEKQVCAHLEGHIRGLPSGDQRSRAIIHQMLEDEARHGDTAMAAGGAVLPPPVRDAMQLMSKVMTKSAYWI